MKIVNKYFRVLDYGFIALKDYMGSDQDIEQAARISYQSGTRKVSDTRNLIRYLMRHRHTSPFEQAELKFHVKVPMYIWRQWIRHRMSSTNEVSSRYSVLPNEFHKTKKDEWRLQSKNNKQGSDKRCVNEICGLSLTSDEQELHSDVSNIYKLRLASGVSKEQARKDLPLSTYTEAFWKIDLHNLLHFLNLRCDKHAQKEIQDYACVIAGIVKELFPITFEAWEDYVFYSRTFSRQELELLSKITKNTTIEIKKDEDMSNREIYEFTNFMNLNEKIDFTLDKHEIIEKE